MVGGISIAERRKMLGVSAADVAADKKKRTAAITAKQKKVSAVQSRQQKPTVQPKPEEKTNKFQQTFQDTKTEQRVEAEPEKKGFLSKALGFLQDPTGVGKQIKGIEEESGEQVFGASPGALGLVSGQPGGAVGSGFGSNGAWVASKALKAQQATKIGSLTTKGTGAAKTVAGVTQTNSKTFRLLKGMWDKTAKALLTTKKTISVTNPVTGKVTQSVVSETSITKLAISIGVLGYAADKMFGGKNFGNFEGQAEAGQASGMAVWMAQSSDNYVEYLEARELQKQSFEFEAGLVPYKNLADGIENNIDVMRGAGEVMDKIMFDREQARINGTDIAGQIKQSLLDKAAMEKALTDYNNARFLETSAKKREAENISDAVERQKVKDFWDKAEEEDRKKEAEDRQAQADFWIAYDKMKQEMRDDERPSALNFGLI